MSALPIRPNRQLGQHFLVDENILTVIGRLAELDPGDVVLEIGAGLGMLTNFLAERVETVHAIEIDRSLEGSLRDRFGRIPNVHLIFGDALTLPLAELLPAPCKLVANLPYAVATPLCVESLDGLPTVERWCVMVQREIAERFVARPGTRAYGAASVLIQLTADRVGFHPVARTCFRPRPRVDSALLAFRRRRRWGPEYPAVKRLVQGAFAHRRKTLPNALELAGLATRERAVQALASIGHSADVRAQALTPGSSCSCWMRLRDAMPSLDVAAKINLALVVGLPMDTGFHEVATVLQRVSLYDRLELEPAKGLEVAGFEGDTLVRRALELLAAAAGAPSGWSVVLEKRIPLASGLGGGSADAAAALVVANKTLQRPLPVDELRAVALEVGSDVPFFLSPGPKLAEGRGERLTPLDLPQDYWALVAIEPGATKASTGEIYRRFDDAGGGEGFERRRERLLEALAGCRDARDLEALPPNDLGQAAGALGLAARLRERGSFRADVSGAGPAVYGLFERPEDAEAARRELPAGSAAWVVQPVH